MICACLQERQGNEYLIDAFYKIAPALLGQTLTEPSKDCIYQLVRIGLCWRSQPSDKVCMAMISITTVAGEMISKYLTIGDKSNGFLTQIS